MNTRQRVTALAAAVALALTALTGIAPVGASAPTEDPAESAGWGAGWLVAQVQPDGSVVGGFDPLGDAALVALALASAGTGGEAFDRAVAHVVANAESFVAPVATDDVGRIGRALMLAEAAGIDPTNFGGVDLPGRLAASLGAFEPGLYGASNPTFDGAFRQGLALQGLGAVGLTPPGAAITWLAEQQCANGGWTAYRVDIFTPCPASDPALFTGPETNASAAAVLGFHATGIPSPVDPVSFFAGAQNDDGGMPYIPGGTSDPNSTGVAIQALLALGVDPGTITAGPGASLWEALLSWQLGCDRAAGERGAFFYPIPDAPDDPNLLASVDAVPAAAGAIPPLAGPVDLTPTAPVMDCSTPTTTTTSTTAAPSSTTTVPTTAAAQPAALTPTFTG